MTDAPTDQSAKISRSELERLEQSFQHEFSFRTCCGWLLFAFGSLFAVMSVGCIVQHFVDRDMPWGRKPFQDIFEPIYWGLTSILWFAASRQAFHRKYLWALGILAAFFVGTAITVVVVNSVVPGASSNW